MIIQENGGVDPTASTNKASSKKRKASSAPAAKRNNKKASKKQTTSKTNLKNKGGKNGRQNKRQKPSKSRKATSKKGGKMFEAADTPVSMKYGNSRNTNGLIMPENLQLDLSLFSPAGGLIPSPMPHNASVLKNQVEWQRWSPTERPPDIPSATEQDLVRHSSNIECAEESFLTVDGFKIIEISAITKNNMPDVPDGIRKHALFRPGNQRGEGKSGENCQRPRKRSRTLQEA